MEQNYFELLNLNIEFLNFRKHTYTVLKQHLIHKIGDLVSLELCDIIEFDGINEYYSNEILRKVHNFGLCFFDEAIKPKNATDIIIGLKTYNLRKKFNILKALKKEDEILNLEIEVLSLLPYEYETLKAHNIYTIRDLMRTDKKLIKKYFTRVEKNNIPDSLNNKSKALIFYNQVIEQVHQLGLHFNDERIIDESECGVKILNPKYFK